VCVVPTASMLTILWPYISILKFYFSHLCSYLVCLNSYPCLITVFYRRFHIEWVLGALSSGKSGRDMKLTIHLHIVPRLNMRGAVPLFLQYVFMARCLIKQWTRFQGVALVYHRNNVTLHYFTLFYALLDTVLPGWWSSTHTYGCLPVIVPTSTDDVCLLFSTRTYGCLPVILLTSTDDVCLLFSTRAYGCLPVILPTSTDDVCLLFSTRTYGCLPVILPTSTGDVCLLFSTRTYGCLPVIHHHFNQHHVLSSSFCRPTLEASSLPFTSM
jgi:hypothetical protein